MSTKQTVCRITDHIPCHIQKDRIKYDENYHISSIHMIIWFHKYFVWWSLSKSLCRHHFPLKIDEISILLISDFDSLVRIVFIGNSEFLNKLVKNDRIPVRWWFRYLVLLEAETSLLWLCIVEQESVKFNIWLGITTAYLSFKPQIICPWANVTNHRVSSKTFRNCDLRWKLFVPSNWNRLLSIKNCLFSITLIYIPPIICHHCYILSQIEFNSGDIGFTQTRIDFAVDLKTFTLI